MMKKYWPKIENFDLNWAIAKILIQHNKSSILKWNKLTGNSSELTINSWTVYAYLFENEMR